MTIAQRRRAQRALDQAQKRYESAPKGYRLSRLRALRRKIHEQLESELKQAA